jgi:hypothetical protein
MSACHLVVVSNLDCLAEMGRLCSIPVIVLARGTSADMQIVDAFHSVGDLEQSPPERFHLSIKDWRESLSKKFVQIVISIFKEDVIRSLRNRSLIRMPIKLFMFIVGKIANHPVMISETGECFLFVDVDSLVTPFECFQSKVVALDSGENH